MKLIRHFRKYYNNLFVLPPPPPPPKKKNCITIVFNFSWELKTMILQKFLQMGGGGGDKKIIIIYSKVANDNAFLLCNHQ